MAASICMAMRHYKDQKVPCGKCLGCRVEQAAKRGETFKGYKLPKEKK